MASNLGVSLGGNLFSSAESLHDHHRAGLCGQRGDSGGIQTSNNSIAASSGRGFARNNAIVPEIAAPGVNVSTPYGDRSGTSVGAAITAAAAHSLWSGQS